MTPNDRRYLEDRTREQNAAFKSAWRAVPQPERGGSTWSWIALALIGLVVWWGWTGP